MSRINSVEPFSPKFYFCMHMIQEVHVQKTNAIFFLFLFWDDELSLLIHTYPWGLPRDESGHLQSPGWQPTLHVVRYLMWWFASLKRKMSYMTLNGFTETRRCSAPLTLTQPGPSAGVSGSLDSHCSLKPLCSGMGEVVPARTSPALLPPSPRTVLSLSCFKVLQCISCRDWQCKS